MRFCDIDGCKNKHKAHGYCVKHYECFRRYGNHIEKGIKQSTIAKEFNVDQSLISRIKNKKRWKGLK